VLPVPGGPPAVEPLLGVVVKQDQAAPDEQRVDLLDGGIEIGDVVERAAGHHCLERPRLVELLETHPAKERALGRVGVDSRHAMAGVCEAAGEVTSSAADLENRRGRQANVCENEALEVTSHRGW
jgi:hypothetical protein